MPPRTVARARARARARAPPAALAVALALAAGGACDRAKGRTLKPGCPALTRAACARYARGDSSSPAVMDAPSVTASAAGPIIRWLHIPKCGTSFANAVYRYGCGTGVFDSVNTTLASFNGAFEARLVKEIRPEATCYAPAGKMYPHGAAMHLPVGPLDEKLHTLPPGRSLVGLFRQPTQRLISAYYHNMHAHGMDKDHRAKLVARCGRLPEREGLECFARFPGVAGCATKMLLGHACGAVVPLSAANISEAVRRVRDWFAFAGVTDCFDASVCAFHTTMTGGAIAPADSELEHVRAGATRPASGVYDEGLLGGFVDEADEAVYAQALRMLEEYVERDTG